MQNTLVAQVKGFLAGKRLSRLALQTELLALLLAAIVLTIMPVEMLQALATAADWSRDFAVAHRPLVAFGGLLLVGVLTWSAISFLRSAPEIAARRQEREHETTETLRRAA